MANVLGELFGDIASAIREKTGDTATMKPAEFPDKIAAIEVGGGSGGTFVVARGSFTPTSTTAYKLTHGLGVVPIYIQCYGSVLASPPTGTNDTKFASGWSSQILDLFSGSFDYKQFTMYYVKNRSTWSAGSGDYAIEEPDLGGPGMFYSATEQDVMVGKYANQLYTGTTYYWLAIGYKTE